MSVDPVRTPEPRASGVAREPSTVRAAVVADFRAAPARRRLALIGVAIWLLYEWGPGNESVTPWILANVIGRNSGLSVIPLAATVGFVFTTLQQLASGYTALAGFSMFDRTSAAAWERLRGERDVAPGEWSGLPFGQRCALVFGLGTTAVALIQIMTTGETGVRRHAAAVRSSALLCGCIVAVIGGAAAGVAELGRRVDALRTATDWTLRIIGNPLFWIGLFAIPYLGRLAVRRWKRS